MSPVRSLARAKSASPAEFLGGLKHRQETTPRKDLGEATSNGMKISVKAKPGAKEEKIDPPSPGGFGEAEENYYTVSVKEPPVKGQANAAIIKVLAKYFGVTVRRVKIVSGWTSKQKTIEII